jgi:hypothetical protein
MVPSPITHSLSPVAPGEADLLLFIFVVARVGRRAGRTPAFAAVFLIGFPDESFYQIGCRQTNYDNDNNRLHAKSVF